VKPLDLLRWLDEQTFRYNERTDDHGVVGDPDRPCEAAWKTAKV
jgi:hypothetical protein